MNLNKRLHKPLFELGNSYPADSSDVRHAMQETAQAIKQDLLALLPEKEDDTYSDQDVLGYNQAIDDMKTKIEEYTGVKE